MKKTMQEINKAVPTPLTNEKLIITFGKIISQQRPQEWDADVKISERVMAEGQRLIEVENYLNNEVAVKVFKKFGVGIRVHIAG